SAQCNQAHRNFTIVDHKGMEVASAEVGEDLWPRSAGLYFTELELTGSGDQGLLRWEARSSEADLAASDSDMLLPHGSASSGFDIRFVPPPDLKVRVEAWDAERQAPLPGARVILHPYGTVTD